MPNKRTIDLITESYGDQMSVRRKYEFKNSQGEKVVDLYFKPLTRFDRQKAQSVAGTDEAPGKFIYRDGIRFKKYRGMGSLETMAQKMGARYLSTHKSVKVAQGVSGEVVSRGSLKKHIPY